MNVCIGYNRLTYYASHIRVSYEFTNQNFQENEKMTLPSNNKSSSTD